MSRRLGIRLSGLNLYHINPYIYTIPASLIVQPQKQVIPTSNEPYVSMLVLLVL